MATCVKISKARTLIIFLKCDKIINKVEVKTSFSAEYNVFQLVLAQMLAFKSIHVY